MSKLRDNPEKVVPKRVLLLAPIITMLILVVAVVFDLNFFLVGGFFWIATIANMIAFRLIVVGANRIIAKQQTGEKATIIPNLLIRYAMYVAVIAAAWFVGGLAPVISALVGVQMSQIVIKLDSFVG